MKLEESLVAYGHKNIRGTHKTTLEITRADQVSPRGDCIIAVRASRSLKDLGSSFKNLLREKSSEIVLSLKVLGLREEIRGTGDPRLSLSSDDEIVCRKSSFVSERTLMVRSDKAAIDIDRRIIDALRNSGNKVDVTLSVENR